MPPALVLLSQSSIYTQAVKFKAKAVACASEEEVEAQKQYLDETNGKYDEIIKSAQVKLEHLNKETILANKAFKTAKQRYFSLEGDLIDLREAFRNIARVQAEVNETQTQLLQARGSESIAKWRCWIKNPTG